MKGIREEIRREISMGSQEKIEESDSGCCLNSRHESRQETEIGCGSGSESGSIIKKYILVGLVMALLVFSVVQNFQLKNLERDVLSGAVVNGGALKGTLKGTAASSPVSGAPAGGGAKASAAIPAMVGGC